MKRIRTGDRLLLILAVPLFLACFSLSLRETVRGTLAWVPVQVSADPDGGFPRIRSLWPGVAQEELAVGDRLTKVGSHDLQGVGAFGFALRAMAANAQGLRVPVTLASPEGSADRTLQLLAVGNAWRVPALALGIFAIGLCLIFGGPTSGAARAAFHCHVAYAFHWLLFPGQSLLQSGLWAIIFLLTTAMIFPLILRALDRLAPPLAPPSRSSRILPWVFVVLILPSASWVFGTPWSGQTGAALTQACNAVFLLSCFVLLVRRYRQADPATTRRLRWVFWGFYTGTAPIFFSATLASIFPEFWWLHEITMIAPLAIPVALLFAIVREQLFDIDRLIGATASFSILSVLILVLLLVTVPIGTPMLVEILGLEPSFIQSALAVVLVAGALPFQPLLRRKIDSRFFPERHRLETGIQDLLVEIASSPSGEEAFVRYGRGLDALLAPSSCSISRTTADGGTVPFFSRGLSLPAEQPLKMLSAELVLRQSPWVLPWKRGRIDTPVLDRTESETLEMLAADLVCPIRRGGNLTALAIVGQKRTRDLYTASDVALVAAATGTLSTTLDRFDDAKLFEEMEELQKSMRRYVPSGVAEAIARGESLAPRETEVAVLLVDLREYSRMLEQEGAEKMFEVVSRFTEVVSNIIVQHGGQVAEFGGDGMMALFGAPLPLEAKEAAAAKAGLQIIHSVRQLPTWPGGPALDPAVGIATGNAIVGNILSAGRTIWSAIGSSVNLAARLETATRTTDASILIDTRTYAALEELQKEFLTGPPLELKGFAEPQPVFLRPR